MEILYKSKNAIVVYKEPFVPSQSDPSGDPDAMTLLSNELLSIGENPHLWLVHRLDRVVGGLLIFARSKKYAAILSEYVKDRLLTKEYYAVVDGVAEDSTLENWLYKDQRSGKAFIVDRERSGAKLARLSYRTLSTVNTDKGEKSLIYVTLDTGRFHQIRAQLSGAGLSITGDGKYGSHDNRAKRIALMASHLGVDLGAEKIDVCRLPDLDVYPWSLFDRKDFDL